MPKPAMPPSGQKERMNKKDKALIASACLLFVAVVSAFIYWEPNFFERLTQQESEPRLLDFTGQIFYGKDESTGVCFAARFHSAKYGFTRVPCEALERLK